MNLTRREADCLMTLLDIATENDWPRIAEKITEHAEPKDIVRAWRGLESLAGRKNGVPDIDEF